MLFSRSFGNYSFKHLQGFSNILPGKAATLLVGFRVAAYIMKSTYLWIKSTGPLLFQTESSCQVGWVKPMKCFIRHWYWMNATFELSARFLCLNIKSTEMTWRLQGHLSEDVRNEIAISHSATRRKLNTSLSLRRKVHINSRESVTEGQHLKTEQGTVEHLIGLSFTQCCVWYGLNGWVSCWWYNQFISSVGEEPIQPESSLLCSCICNCHWRTLEE